MAPNVIRKGRTRELARGGRRSSPRKTREETLMRHLVLFLLTTFMGIFVGGCDRQTAPAPRPSVIKDENGQYLIILPPSETGTGESVAVPVSRPASGTSGK